MSPDVLDREIAAIVSESATHRSVRSEASAPKGFSPTPVTFDKKPSPRAAGHLRASEATMTVVLTPAVRTKRDAAKAAPRGTLAVAAPSGWRAIGYGETTHEPPHGVEPALLTSPQRSRERGFIYAFLILNQQLSTALEKKPQSQGVQILGLHGSAVKARVPADPARLKAIDTLNAVDSLAFPRQDQKIEAVMRDTVQRYRGKLPNLPVIVSAFDGAALEEVKTWLAQAGATIGRLDTQLYSVSAVLPADWLDELARRDSVLFIELSRPGSGGHDPSMAVMGADYVRPGGVGTRFSGAPIILGILDTGFIVGGAAPTPHQDLNKFGCGRNFSSDAAGVWNDQNGHGTHVLATATGTGTAQARFRGVARGIGGSGTTRIRGQDLEFRRHRLGERRTEWTRLHG